MTLQSDYTPPHPLGPDYKWSVNWRDENETIWETEFFGARYFLCYSREEWTAWSSYVLGLRSTYECGSLQQCTEFLYCLMRDRAQCAMGAVSNSPYA